MSQVEVISGLANFLNSKRKSTGYLYNCHRKAVESGDQKEIEITLRSLAENRVEVAAILHCMSIALRGAGCDYLWNSLGADLCRS